VPGPRVKAGNNLSFYVPEVNEWESSTNKVSNLGWKIGVEQEIYKYT
jgi:hypothetical protein